MVGGVARESYPAGAKDGHLVREGLHLRQLVAYEDDRHVGGHAREEDDQFVGLLGSKRRSRLVENEEFRPEAERLDQLDPLLLADRKLPHIRVGLNREAVAL